MNLKIPEKPRREFLPQDFNISDWDRLEPFFRDLDEREINGFDDLCKWLRNRSELEAVLEEELAWRYIRMNINTRDKEASEAFHYFIENIEPKIAPFQDRFDHKILEQSFPELKSDSALNIVYKKARFHSEIFREKNIPIQTKLQSKSQEFGTISSEMSIEFEGKEYTLPQAGVFLKDPDRSKREAVYNLIQQRRLEDKDKLNDLFNELIGMRHEVAVNADLPNFRDYKFMDLCRMDYTKEDCFNFHKSVAGEVVPLLREFDEERRKELNLQQLKPWDTQVDASGKPALKPFADSKDLIRKTINCFNGIDPYFGNCIAVMDKMGHLDLDSRSGKAPGGFNYPLYEIGVPFIYMNSAGTLRDLTTMVHEGGHAIHSFLSRELAITAFKDLTSEVAELASMSMELISMEHWHHFFSEEEDYKRAKKEQLQGVIETLPWVAQIDKFQHWIYENPEHSVKDREQFWLKLMDGFSSPTVDWTGLEESRTNLWQKQLHLYEVPFYYIEYGMAQLGAIAIWKNYKSNPEETVRQYREALSLGYTRSIGEIYETAGISFDFSSDYVGSLVSFVRDELNAI